MEIAECFSGTLGEENIDRSCVDEWEVGLDWGRGVGVVDREDNLEAVEGRAGILMDYVLNWGGVVHLLVKVQR